MLDVNKEKKHFPKSNQLNETWCAVKCELTKRNEVPNNRNAIATAPLVLNVAVGRVLKESTSGMEQNQI